MDDEADLKKMIDVLKNTREESEELHYQEFINFEESEGEEECIQIDDQQTNPEYDLENPFTIDIATLYKYNPISTLTPEERVVIDSCKDPELKKLLIVNRQKNMQLIQLYKKYKDLLIECKQNIVEKNEIVKQYFQSHKVQKQASGSWRVCAPYFKDKDFYVSPLNCDTIRKKSNQELSYYDLLPIKKWTKYECNRLTRAIQLNYTMNICTKLRKRKKLLEAEPNTSESRAQLQELNAQLNKLTKLENYEIPPLGSDEDINWIRVADVFVKDKHSDFECRSFWHIFLHPAINKGPWKPEENQKLVELAEMYKCQNWDVIAKELQTNRTSFTVATNYFSQFHIAFKKGEFTFSEDRKLLDLVNKYRIGHHIPWVKIARHFKTRTRAQLHHRYTYYLSQIDKKRGKFTIAEDVLILLCLEKFGNNFKKCTEYLPDRSVVQIKARYNTNLKQVIKKGVWTVEEDEMILAHHANYKNSVKGVSWCDLSVKMRRARGQLRQRYLVLKQYLDQHPGSSVADVPRRKHIHRPYHDSYTIVRGLVDQLIEEHCIPSLEEIENMLKTHDSDSLIDMKEEKNNPQPSVKSSELDDLLTDFFSNCQDEPLTTLTPMNTKNAAVDVESILDVLKVNLDIPDNLADIPYLDQIDCDILTDINKNTSTRHNQDIKRIVPVNFHTASAMRSLLIKYSNFKKKRLCSSKREQIFGHLETSRNECLKSRLAIAQESAHMPVEDKVPLEADRNLFYRRFLSLFKFPAILTLESPSRELVSVSQHIIETEYRPPIKRTYSKKQNSDSEPSHKIRILEGNPQTSLKLTPVKNNSVIVNLLTDNTKKLFCLDEVQMGNETRTLVKEVDLDSLSRTEGSLSQSSEVKPNLRRIGGNKETDKVTKLKTVSRISLKKEEKTKKPGTGTNKKASSRKNIKLEERDAEETVANNNKKTHSETNVALQEKNKNKKHASKVNVKLETPSTSISADYLGLDPIQESEDALMHYTESEIFEDDSDLIDLDKLRKFIKQEKAARE